MDKFIPEDCVIIRADKRYSDGVLDCWFFAIKTKNEDVIEWINEDLSDMATHKEIKEMCMGFLHNHPDSYTIREVRDKKINLVLDDKC